MSFFSLIPLNNKYPALHGLRFLAICAVVQLHASQTLSRVEWIPGPIVKLSRGSWFGMDFFFIMSGFLIGCILIHSMKKENFSFLSFYSRRFLRLIPLYIVCLVGIYLLNRVILHEDGHNWREWVYLTNYPYSRDYTMPWSWSLSLEEHFYIMVPVFMLFLLRIKNFMLQAGLLLAGWLACLLIKLYIMSGVSGPVDFLWWFERIYTPTHTRFDSLLTGILTALLVARSSDRIGRVFQRPVRSALIISILTLGLLSVAVMFQLNTSVTSVDYYRLGTMLVGTVPSILFIGVILWGIYSNSQLQKLLSSPVFLVPATLGYGCYLVHIPVIKMMVMPYLHPMIRDATSSAALIWLLVVLCSLVLSFSVAYVLHLIVEKPTLYLRDKLYERDLSAALSDPRKEPVVQ